MAAIFVRSAFEELVRIENSTVLPSESTRLDSPFAPLFQEKPASLRSARACSSDLAGCGMDAFTQRRFPGVTGPHNAAPRPWEISRKIAWRSMAAETAWRNFTSWNHFDFCAHPGAVFSPRSFKLKNR